MIDRNKHKYGEGNVYQTATGEWRGRIALKDPATGKKMKPKIFYNGKSEAEIWRKIKAYKNDPLNYSGNVASQADAARYFRKWLEEYKKPRIKISSYDRLDETLRLYVEPELRNIQLQAVSADDCNDIISVMANVCVNSDILIGIMSSSTSPSRIALYFFKYSLYVYPSIRKSHPDWHYKRCKAIALYIGIKIARRR